MLFIVGSTEEKYAVYNPADDSLVGEINFAGDILATTDNLLLPSFSVLASLGNLVYTSPPLRIACNITHSSFSSLQALYSRWLNNLAHYLV
jgi:hypothetical protein